MRYLFENLFIKNDIWIWEFDLFIILFILFLTKKMQKNLSFIFFFKKVNYENLKTLGWLIGEMRSQERFFLEYLWKKKKTPLKKKSFSQKIPFRKFFKERPSKIIFQSKLIKFQANFLGLWRVWFSVSQVMIICWFFAIWMKIFLEYHYFFYGIWIISRQDNMIPLSFS